MLTKKVKSRIALLSILLLTASIIIFFILKSLEENVVYFFSPTEIFHKSNISFDKKIRIGGLVKENSIYKDNNSIKFVVTKIRFSFSSSSLEIFFYSLS